MNHALIEGARIAQIADQPFPVAEPLVWRECPDEVDTTWTWGGAAFVPPPEPDPNPVPQIVSRFQARAVLMLAGKLEAVQAAVDGSDDPLVKLAWSEAVEFNRQSPTIAALAGAIGLTEAEVDDLFRQAATITA